MSERIENGTIQTVSLPKMDIIHPEKIDMVPNSPTPPPISYVTRPNMHTDSYYISVLTVFSSLAVVFLHCNGVFWAHNREIWLSSCLIETLFYFAVPVFFMISGSTLIDYRERYSTKEYFRKRFKRTVVPWLSWSLISLLYWKWNHASADLSVEMVISGILNNRFMRIYWFFMPLFAIYISIPVLSNIRDKRKTFIYMITLALIFDCLFPCLNSLGLTGFHRFLTIPVCSGCLIYPLLGWILHKSDISRNVRWCIYIAGMIGFLAHFSASYYMTPDEGPICKLFKNYMYITTVAQACAVFVFFKYNTRFFIDCVFVRKIINFIQPATLGIYLSHIFVHKFFGLYGFHTSLIYRTIGAIIIFIGLAALIRLLKKIPIFKLLFS